MIDVNILTMAIVYGFGIDSIAGAIADKVLGKERSKRSVIFTILWAVCFYVSQTGVWL